ncbi:MAG: hypothetical protein ACI82A_003217 [Candidatus Azotimanducaceae bacterium]|jgi:hypothetical protein
MTTTEVIETVNANAKAVWDILGDFGGIKVGGPITAFEIEGDGVGAVRTITMGGAHVVERLEAFDANGMSLQYAIINDDCPLPVSGYSATINVTAAGDDACTVVWVGTFDAKGAPEAQAAKVVKGIYTSSIAAARKATGG